MFYIMYLTSLCQRRNWAEPVYETYPTQHGYGCTVTVDNRDFSTDVAYESVDLARNAAATRAYMICRNFSYHSSSFDTAAHQEGLPFVVEARPGRSQRTSNNSDAASVMTFHTARSRQSAQMGNVERPLSRWCQHLMHINLVPIPKFDETDWSGRGQHAEFDISEEAEVEALLKPRGHLGHSAVAFVEKVQCRRILLARKKIKCSWRLKREEAIEEVRHLQRLEYSHIVRGVGTYVLGNELCILLYPATEHSLESFLDHCFEMNSVSASSNTQENTATLNNLLSSLQGFFECLTNTIYYTHSELVKHMDIKPSNILVKESIGSRLTYKVYLADFGNSRSYEAPEDVETDSKTAFTKTYAAPEVIQQDTRGFGADIFSLGCVFLEMLAVLCEPMQRSSLADIRRENSSSDASYQANIGTILTRDLFSDPRLDYACYNKWLEETKRMVNLDPQHRPTASALRETFGNGQDCCYQGYVPFEATGDPDIAHILREAGEWIPHEEQRQRTMIADILRLETDTPIQELKH